MRSHLSAWVFVGAIVFAVGLSWGQDVLVAISSAPLMGSATGAALLPEEPFVNPFGTKKPRIVSGFGKRGIPNQPLPEMHEGVDYAAPLGTPVRAARSGKVIFAGFSKMYASRADKSEQNRLVIIRHVDGKSSRYVHLGTLHVKPGQDVLSGQVLGVLDESDEWTEPVLHFEIRDVQGQAVNPKAVVVDMKQP